jgi:hypothetical protein
MPPFFTEEGNRFGADLKSISFYCTFTALNCKCLIINGAGEGNRTLVFQAWEASSIGPNSPCGPRGGFTVQHSPHLLVIWFLKPCASSFKSA